MSGRFRLRDNLFLVAGVALPLGVVAFYLAASALPRLWVDPPEHDFLFTASRVYPSHEANRQLEFAVRDGELVGRVRTPPDRHNTTVPELFRYDHRSDETRRIEVEIPEGLAIGDSFAVGGYRLRTEARSPDGWRVERREPGDRGPFGELFGIDRGRTVYVLRKRGRVVPVHPPPEADWRRYYYQRAEFLGWLADE